MQKKTYVDINLVKRLFFITKSGTVLDTFQKAKKSVSNELIIKFCKNIFTKNAKTKN